MKRYKVIAGGVLKDSVDRYVSSIDFDKKLVKYVAMVVLVHVKELTNDGFIHTDIAKKIVSELLKIIETEGKYLYDWIEKREEKFEDVFEALELYLHNIVGEDAGRIALGRSRNDHIAAVLRLAIREHVIKILNKLIDIRKKFIDKSIKYKDSLFPFFTHAQLAQCGSAAHYFLAYEHAFSVIWKMIFNSLDYLNQNPLGSGASIGTSISINKKFLSNLLCFDSTPIPPYYATGSRLFMLYVASVTTMLMTEIGRFIEDIMILNNIIPQGIEIPMHHISTSSIMPHKRNLVTLEISRAKVSKVIGDLMSLLSAYKSVPYGYNLDFQEMNNYFYNLIEETENVLNIFEDFLNGLEINNKIISEYLDNKPCWSSDVIEYLSIKENIPVRILYIELAKAFQEYHKDLGKSLDIFFRSHNLEQNKVWEILKQKPVEKELSDMIKLSLDKLDKDYEAMNQLQNILTRCNEELINMFLQG